MVAHELNVREYANVFTHPRPLPEHVSISYKEMMNRERWVRVVNHALKSQGQPLLQQWTERQMFLMSNGELQTVFVIYKQMTLWVWRHLVWSLIKKRKLTVKVTDCPALHGHNTFLILETVLRTGEMRIQETRASDGKIMRPTTVDGPELIPQLVDLLKSDVIPLRNEASWEQPVIVTPEFSETKVREKRKPIRPYWRREPVDEEAPLFTK